MFEDRAEQIESLGLPGVFKCRVQSRRRETRGNTLRAGCQRARAASGQVSWASGPVMGKLAPVAGYLVGLPLYSLVDNIEVLVQ